MHYVIGERNNDTSRNFPMPFAAVGVVTVYLQINRGMLKVLIEGKADSMTQNPPSSGSQTVNRIGVFI